MFTFFVKNYYVLVDSTKFALHLLHYAILRLTNCYYRRNIYHVSLRNIYDMIMILSISKTPCFYLTPSFFILMFRDAYPHQDILISSNHPWNHC